MQYQHSSLQNWPAAPSEVQYLIYVPVMFCEVFWSMNLSEVNACWWRELAWRKPCEESCQQGSVCFTGSFPLLSVISVEPMVCREFFAYGPITPKQSTPIGRREIASASTYILKVDNFVYSVKFFPDKGTDKRYIAHLEEACTLERTPQ